MLWAAILFYFYLESVWLLIGFLLFVPLMSCPWVWLAQMASIGSLLSIFPDWGDLSCVLSGEGGEVRTICSQASLVRGDKVL